jgi:hypothetical protein
MSVLPPPLAAFVGAVGLADGFLSVVLAAVDGRDWDSQSAGGFGARAGLFDVGEHAGPEATDVPGSGEVMDVFGFVADVLACHVDHA